MTKYGKMNICMFRIVTWARSFLAYANKSENSDPPPQSITIHFWSEPTSCVVNWL